MKFFANSKSRASILVNRIIHGSFAKWNPVANNEMIFNRIIFSIQIWQTRAHTHTHIRPTQRQTTMCVRCAHVRAVICCVRFTNVNVSCAFSRSFDFTMKPEKYDYSRAGRQQHMCRQRWTVHPILPQTLLYVASGSNCSAKTNMTKYTVKLHMRARNFDFLTAAANYSTTEGRPKAWKNGEYATTSVFGSFGSLASVRNL